VFHSSAETMLEFQGQLPFEAIADPGRKLYGEFGVEKKMSPHGSTKPALVAGGRPRLDAGAQPARSHR